MSAPPARRGAWGHYAPGMFAVAHSAAVVGVDAQPVRVEAFVSGGLPTFTVVGLPGAAVQESRERVRAALKQLGLPLPPSRIVVNLAPADLRKEGPAFDLPIALALLAADRRLPLPALKNLIVFGELALDGSVQAVRGAVSIAALAAGNPEGAGPFRSLLVPPGNAAEVGLVPGVRAVSVPSLAQAVAHLTGRNALPVVLPTPAPERPSEPQPDLLEVRGQALAKRALEIAAAGRHNLLLTGPPGAGKTMLALRLTGLLPPLTPAEALEVTRVHSSAGLLNDRGETALPRTPLLRRPHHTSSEAGILGGGVPPRPGEVSLAHRGVLFLDELPEFRRSVLESLRQPLEEGWVTLSRARHTLKLPAAFQLVATQNPCPCGEYGAATAGEAPRCNCAPHAVLRYRRRLSGPLLDRFDLRVTVPRLTPLELMGQTRGEASAPVARRVALARRRMLARQGRANAELAGRALKEHARVTSSGERLLEELIAGLRLSGRGYDRLLRMARTVADLDGSTLVGDSHLAEAASYRGAP